MSQITAEPNKSLRVSKDVHDHSDHPFKTSEIKVSKFELNPPDEMPRIIYLQRSPTITDTTPRPDPDTPLILLNEESYRRTKERKLFDVQKLQASSDVIKEVHELNQSR